MQDLHHDDLNIPLDAWTTARGFATILLPLYVLWPNDEFFIGPFGRHLTANNSGDWMTAPLDILLLYGSTLLRNWTASETEVFRSLLILLPECRARVTRSQIIFTCTKLFMPEHSQPTQEGEDDNVSLLWEF
jgi:hypothetical protein